MAMHLRKGAPLLHVDDGMILPVLLQNIAVQTAPLRWVGPFMERRMSRTCCRFSGTGTIFTIDSLMLSNQSEICANDQERTDELKKAL